ncbi:MAG: hypothetical protein LQ339_004213 [Xanthoria mediterranea]|nr:MAG: hypothetical protein LQ339_004213 [Xanthoria mediterranea]
MTGSIHDLSNEIILQIFRELTTPGWPIRTLVKRLFEHLQSPAGEHVIHCVEQIDITAGSRSFCAEDLCLEFMAMLPQFSKLRTIRYEGVRYVPSALLAAISDLYPRVDIDLELCGSVSDCRRVLKDCPNIRAFDFTGFPADYIPGTREVAFVEKQPSLTKLGVALQSLRSFYPPQSDAGFKPMCLEELHLDNDDTPDRPSPNNGLSLCCFADLDTLRVLRLQGHNLIASVLDELSGSTHKLESVSIDGGKRRPPRPPYYDLVLRFFASARLREITSRTLDLVSLGLIAFRTNPPQSVAESGVVRLGVIQDELWRLVTLCPNIQRLGIDLPRVELAVELHTLLKPLLQLYHLRHLHLFSYPIVRPNRLDQPFSERNFLRAILITPHGRTMTHSSLSPSRALKLVSSSELVELFHYLRDRKKGVALETLMYRQGCEDDDVEECMLWYMSGRRVLVSYRYHLYWRHVQVPTEPVEVRELYDETQLLWTQKRKLERETFFDEWTFPS